MNPLATVGAAALVTALALSCCAVGGAAWGHRSGRPGVVAAARRALMATPLFTTIAVAALTAALLTDDFELAYVSSVSSTDMLVHMKWAALYSSQEGSLLFWTWAMSLLLGACAWLTVPRIPWGAPHAVAVGGGVLGAFLVALVFLASPFELNAVTPADGFGLNPLLVDRGMLVHPPFLLTGLVTTVVPFTLGAAALLAGRLDAAWVRAARHWALLSFLVLSVGNLLGGWWAYTTLGWGGYWGWDPVENSALLPLLPMIAFLHSAMVQERRGMLKLWNLALVLSSFALAVFGTFNVRSGLVASVHSFAESEIGPYFLGLLAVVGVGSVALLVWRSALLRADHEFESLASRETTLILNNYVLAAATLVILGGTLFPVFSELFDGSRVSVGPPFYNDTVGPLAVALLVLVAVGTVIPWRRAAPGTLRRRAVAPAVGLLVLAVLLPAAGLRDPWALATVLAAAAIGLVTLREFALGARAGRRATGQRWPGALAALFERDRRRYGGFVVHLGLAVMAVAAVGSTVYQQQVRAVVQPGEEFQVGRYTVAYDGLVERPGTGNGIQSEIRAQARVLSGDRQVTLLEPGRRFFTNFPDQPMTVVGVDSGWREDIYLFVQGWDDAGNAEFNAFVNPLMVWLWFGAAIYVAGGLVAFAPVAAPAPAPLPAPSSGREGVQRA